NLAFFPMHQLGLEGMPRRTYHYPQAPEWQGLNDVSTIGAYIIALAILVFLWNVFDSIALGHGKPAGDDPWVADTLEWATTSPPLSPGRRRAPARDRRRGPVSATGRARRDHRGPRAAAGVGDAPSRERRALARDAHHPRGRGAMARARALARTALDLARARSRRWHVRTDAQWGVRPRRRCDGGMPDLPP